MSHSTGCLDLAPLLNNLKGLYVPEDHSSNLDSRNPTSISGLLRQEVLLFTALWKQNRALEEQSVCTYMEEMKTSPSSKYRNHLCYSAFFFFFSGVVCAFYICTGKR